MIVYLLLGLGLLLLLLFLGRVWADAEPAQLKRFLRWLGIALLMGAVLFLAVTGRLAAAFAALAAAVPFFLRWQGILQMLWRPLRGIFGAGSGQGRHSTIETRFLRMTLDHGSGRLEGEVREGDHAGTPLDQLDRPALEGLLATYRQADPQSAALLEAYLDRRFGGAQGGPTRPRADKAMTREEAYKILGLEDGASTAEIRAAHRRLMQQLHPDQGGSTYLATKVNQARDYLLGR